MANNKSKSAGKIFPDNATSSVGEFARASENQNPVTWLVGEDARRESIWTFVQRIFRFAQWKTGLNLQKHFGFTFQVIMHSRWRRREKTLWKQEWLIWNWDQQRITWIACLHPKLLGLAHPFVRAEEIFSFTTVSKVTLTWLAELLFKVFRFVLFLSYWNSSTLFCFFMKSHRYLDPVLGPSTIRPRPILHVLFNIPPRSPLTWRTLMMLNVNLTWPLSNLLMLLSLLLWQALLRNAIFCLGRGAARRPNKDQPANEGSAELLLLVNYIVLNVM